MRYERIIGVFNKIKITYMQIMTFPINEIRVMKMRNYFLTFLHHFEKNIRNFLIILRIFTVLNDTPLHALEYVYEVCEAMNQKK